MNISKKILITTLVLAVFILILNNIATHKSWYFFIWWFDMPMHALGGLFVSFLATSLFVSKRFSSKIYREGQFFFSVIVSVFVIGILWEVFELSIEKLVQFAELVSFKDSVSDMFFDLAGGMIGALIGLSVYRKHRIVNINKSYAQ